MTIRCRGQCSQIALEAKHVLSHLLRKFSLKCHEACFVLNQKGVDGWLSEKLLEDKFYGYQQIFEWL